MMHPEPDFIDSTQCKTNFYFESFPPPQPDYLGPPPAVLGLMKKLPTTKIESGFDPLSRYLRQFDSA